MIPPTYVSPAQAQTILTGEAQRLEFNASFIPKTGPTGKRLLIDCLTVHCILNVTVAVTAIEGEDVWGAIGAVDLMQTDTVPRIVGMDGKYLRMAMIEKASSNHVKEHIDLPIAGATTYNLSFPLWLASPMAMDEADTALPVELFQSLGFTAARPNANGLGVGGGTITINSASWYVVAQCREVDYAFVPVPDRIDMVRYGATADLQMPIVNGRMAGLLLMRPGTAGGLTLPNITSVKIDELIRDAVRPDPDLIELYARLRGSVTGSNAASPGVQLRNDPVMAGKAIPLVFAHRNFKALSSPYLASCQIRTVQSSAYTDIVAIRRLLLAKNPANHAFFEDIHGALQWSLKTAAKTRRDPSKWKKLDADFIPSKALIPSLVGR